MVQCILISSILFVGFEKMGLAIQIGIGKLIFQGAISKNQDNECKCGWIQS